MAFANPDRLNMFRQVATYGRSGTITKNTHEGQIGSLTGVSPLVKVGADGEQPLGPFVTINGDEIGVQVGGFTGNVGYTGAAPTAGQVNTLLVNATGGVKTDATGRPVFVDSVNTGNTTCVLLLP